MTDRLLSVEKRVLAAYREFFGENYTPSQQNTDIHIRMHKMCYFLSRIDCDVIDAGFVWNTFGPFSVLLQDVLRRIDAKKDMLDVFYQHYEVDNVLDTDIVNGINKLKSGLKVSDHSENPRYWIELLASLAFISHSELLTSDFNRANKELKNRKSVYGCDDENKMAWNLLDEMGFVH